MGSASKCSTTYSLFPQSQGLHIAPSLHLALVLHDGLCVLLVVWYVNSTDLGQTNSYARPQGGNNIEASFAREVISSSALSLFNTAHKGLVTYDFSVWDGTVSGAKVCIQVPYLGLVVIET